MGYEMTTGMNPAHNIKKDTKYPVSRPHQSRSVMRAEVIDRTYDRRGNSVEYSQPKGMHVDSYA